MALSYPSFKDLIHLLLLLPYHAKQISHKENEKGRLNNHGRSQSQYMLDKII